MNPNASLTDNDIAHYAKALRFAAYTEVITGSFASANAPTRTGSATILSPYSLAPFYGYPHANNISVRYGKLLQALHGLSVDEVKSTISTRKRGGPVAVYDKHATEWGQYALDLVSANGGWNKFCAIQKFSDIMEPEKYRSPASVSRPMTAPVASRAIHLYNNRYIQVLATPVGVLWPLWFFADPEWREVVNKQIDSETPQSRIGPYIDHKSMIFIDINHSKGEFCNMPYPFSVADNALAEVAQHPRVSESQSLQQWETVDIDAIAESSAFCSSWSPPLLIPRRAQRPGERRVRSTHSLCTYISISGVCDIFPSVFISSSARETLSHQTLENRHPHERTLTAVYEKGTWGETAAQHLKLRFTDNRPDLVLSYFPRDLEWAHRQDYLRIDRESAYDLNVFTHEELDALFPSLIATHLQGSNALHNQAGMSLLIQDFARFLGKIEHIIGHLRPDPKDLPSTTNDTALCIRKSLNILYKTSEGAERLTSLWTAYLRGREGNVVRLPDRFLQKTLASITQRMLKVPDQPANECSWAILLLYTYFSSIFISTEVF
ncbi:hypothetical protein [Candidatus Thiodictyon syntrophicum]|uniref:hypothetical protein n=1 Tax=Candidatus Thiodictyon syntrophicum TaxID=1166950 RepID=UPI0012FD0438|nr:hypothetical protein [Candidatus Thiodictyon syntrophicum]